MRWQLAKSYSTLLCFVYILRYNPEDIKKVFCWFGILIYLLIDRFYKVLSLQKKSINLQNALWIFSLVCFTVVLLFQYLRELVRMYHGRNSTAIYQFLVQFSKKWMQFVTTNTEPGRGTKPRWWLICYQPTIFVQFLTILVPFFCCFFFEKESSFLAENWTAASPWSFKDMRNILV